MTMVLHTNNRKLDYHQQIHVVVPGVAIDKGHPPVLVEGGRRLYFSSNRPCEGFPVPLPSNIPKVKAAVSNLELCLERTFCKAVMHILRFRSINCRHG